MLFGVFVALFGQNPLDLYSLMYQGGSAPGSRGRTRCTRAAPLILTALCVALPAQLGLVIIGGEGALVLGGARRRRRGAARCRRRRRWSSMLAMACAGMIGGGLWIALAGALRQYRGVNETISSLLLAYIAHRVFNHLVEGPLRDPASLNKPSTRADRRRQHDRQHSGHGRALGPGARHHRLPRRLTS